MVAATAGFAVEDAFLKAAARSVPVGQVLIWFGLGGAVLFAALARMSEQRILTRAAMSRTMVVRVPFEMCGRLFYVLAFALAPLSSATAILQATPIVVVAGAAVFFGETVGWRRWLAIFVGLAGVLIVIRPGTDDFTLYSVFAVLGMLGFAGRDLATRAAPPALGTYALGVYGFATIVLAGFCYWAFESAPYEPPGPRAALALAGSVGFGVAAYSALTRAMRTGEVAAVTPFRYSRLLFGLGLGMLFFGERPDLPTIVGSLIVVASGLYILARSRKAGTG